MNKALNSTLALAALCLSAALGPVATHAQPAATALDAANTWKDDLTPLAAVDWNYDRAAHLLERAGFGGTPEQIEALAALSPSAAVRSLVYFDDTNNSHLQPFDHSGIHDPGLEPFPPSRPATTDLAKAAGEALGIKVKPEGNRRLQPVVNKFFYWWPSIGGGALVTQGAGFRMGIQFFGFYGSYVYRRDEIAALEGRIERNISIAGLRAVLPFEGKEVQFEVTTGPWSNLHSDDITESGVVDFKGVTSAYEALKNCQR